MTALALALVLAGAVPADKVAHAGVGALVAQVATKGLCAAGSNLRHEYGTRHRRCRFADYMFGALAGMVVGLLKEQYDQVRGNGADNNDALAGAAGAVVGAALVVEW